MITEEYEFEFTPADDDDTIARMPLRRSLSRRENIRSEAEWKVHEGFGSLCDVLADKGNLSILFCLAICAVGTKLSLCAL